MEHLKSDFLLKPTSDDFRRNLDSALTNEKYLSHKTLYRIWIRLYYSLECAGDAKEIIPHVNQSIWADFIYLLFKIRCQGDDLFSSLNKFKTKQFCEADAMLAAYSLYEPPHDAGLASSLYWKLSDLYSSRNSIEAAYALGQIYSGSLNSGLYANSNLFITNTSSSIACLEFAASSRKREAYRDLSSIYFAKGLFLKANEYLNSAANAGDSVALARLERSKIDSVVNPAIIEVKSENEHTPSIETKSDHQTDINRHAAEKSFAITKLQNKRFVVLDFETTDLYINHGARVIEIGFVEVVGSKITREYSTVINHQTKRKNNAETINRISREMIKRAPAADVEIPKLIGVLQGSILVAHNITFELNFLKSECDHLMIQDSLKYISTLCTLRRAKRLFPSLPNHKLGTVINYLEIPMDGSAHRALPDAKATARLLLKMIELDPQGVLENIQSVI